MTTLRRVGLAAVALGLLLAATGRSVVPGGDYLYVLVVLSAVAAVVVGVSYAVDRRFDAATPWRPTDTEPGIRAPAPGDALAEASEGAVRKRIRTAVIDALDCPSEAAASRVKAGDWTDDPFAAAYLGGPAVRVSATRRVAVALSGESLAERSRRRSVAALRDLRGDGDG